MYKFTGFFEDIWGTKTAAFVISSFYKDVVKWYNHSIRSYFQDKFMPLNRTIKVGEWYSLLPCPLSASLQGSSYYGNMGRVGYQHSFLPSKVVLLCVLKTIYFKKPRSHTRLILLLEVYGIYSMAWIWYIPVGNEKKPALVLLTTTTRKWLIFGLCHFSYNKSKSVKGPLVP